MSALVIYNNELANKSVTELIDNTGCNFTYDYVNQVGYLHFATCIEAKEFYDKMQELLATIYELENSYNDNSKIIFTICYKLLTNILQICYNNNINNISITQKRKRDFYE